MSDRNGPRAGSAHRGPGSSTGAALSPSDFTVLDCEPGRFLFGHWKNVTILAWAALADASVIARLRSALSRVIALHPEGRSTVSIIAEGLPLPTPEARAAIVDLIKENADNIACIAPPAGKSPVLVFSALRKTQPTAPRPLAF